MPPSLYPWPERDLLKSPEFYMFSPWHGEDFLKAYLSLRESHAVRFEKQYLAQVRSAGPSPALPAVRAILEGDDPELSPEVRQFHRTLAPPAPPAPLPLKSIETLNPIPTREALLSLRAALASAEAGAPETARHWIDAFVKRFEVTKKIHGAYTPQMRRAGDDCTVVLNYALLAELLVFHYGRTESLKALNAALKLNDVLCSAAPSIRDPAELLAGVLSLRREAGSIRRLMDAKGVLP